MMKGEKMESHKKKILKLKYFSPLRILTSPLFEETLGAFLFLPHFFFFSIHFLSFFYAPSLWGFWWYLRKKSLLKKFLFKWNGMVITVDILVVDAYSGMVLCTPIYLNHDYGDGGVVDISAVDVYSGVEVCMPIFLGEASKSCG
jgi:hypothetical protein